MQPDKKTWDRKTWLGIRVVAFAEIAILLAFILIIAMFAGDTERFRNVNPHPFWLVILLPACQYGTREGVLATIAASFALLLGNLPPENITQDHYSWWLGVWKLPILWLGTAVILGELRQRHRRENDRLVTQCHEANMRENNIAEAYAKVRSSKEELELRISGKLRSGLAAWQASKRLESLDKSEIIAGAADLISAVLSAESFSIYTIENGKPFLAYAHGELSNGNLDKPDFHFGSQLYNALLAETQPLCVINPDHELLLSGKAVLAGVLRDKVTNTAMGFLLIDKLPFSELHFSGIASFSALCEWVGTSLSATQKYKDVRETSILNPDHQCYSNGYYTRYVDYIESLAKRLNFDVTRINAALKNPENLSSHEQANAARSLGASVDEVLRQVDLAFDYRKDGSDIAVILPATSLNQAQLVISKLEAALTNRGVDKKLFNFTVQAIHAA